MSERELDTLLDRMLEEYSFSAANQPPEITDLWQRLVARVEEEVEQRYQVRSSNIARSPRIPVIGISHPRHSPRLTRDLVVAVAIDTVDERVLLQLTQGVESAREAVTETSERLSAELRRDKLSDRLYQLADRYRGHLSKFDSTDSSNGPTPRRIYFDDSLATSTNEYYGPACIIHHVYRPGERTNYTPDYVLTDFGNQLEYLIEEIDIDRPKDARVSYSSLWYDRNSVDANASGLTRVATIEEVEGPAGRVEFYDVGFTDDGPHLRHVGSGSLSREALPDEPFETTFTVSEPVPSTIRVRARLGPALVGITPSDELDTLVQNVIDELSQPSVSGVDG